MIDLASSKATSSEPRVVSETESSRDAEPLESLGARLEMCRRYLLLVANREIDSELKRKGGASDLVQETFIEAQRRFGRFHGETESELRAWLRQILIYKIADFARRYRRTAKRRQDLEVDLDFLRGSKECPVVETTPSWYAVSSEEGEVLEHAILELPEAYRRVVLLINREHLTFAEAGRQLDRSSEAARKLWVRAIMRLRKEIGAVHDNR